MPVQDGQVHVYFAAQPSAAPYELATPLLTISLWSFASALDREAASWLGKELVFVVDSFLPGYERIGQLMANYTGESTVVADRRLWPTLADVIVSSAAVRKGANGRGYLGAAATEGKPDGSWWRYRPRRPGIRHAHELPGVRAHQLSGGPARPGRTRSRASPKRQRMRRTTSSSRVR